MKNQTRSRIAWSLTVLTFVAGTLVTVFTGDEAGSSTPENAKDSPPPIAAIREKSGDGCLVDPAAIEDLKKHRDELDAKNKELTAKESELKAREQALNEQLKKLEDVRDEITRAEVSKKKDFEEKVSKLVETFETMSPKSASQVLSTIDESLAVSAMSRISTARLAKIMNVMEPAKSSRLTEILAGVARARHTSTSRKSNDVAVAINITEGGEKYDEHNSNKPNANVTQDSTGSTSSSSPTGQKAEESRSGL